MRSRAGRRRQRRRRRLHRGQGGPAGDRGHRRAVGGGSRRLPVVAGGHAAGGPQETFAEGLATRTAFALPQQILWRLLDDFVLVSEDELRSATRRMIAATSNLVEPAGAAALAAVLERARAARGARVAIVCSGGNISPAQLRALWPGPAELGDGEG